MRKRVRRGLCLVLVVCLLLALVPVGAGANADATPAEECARLAAMVERGAEGRTEPHALVSRDASLADGQVGLMATPPGTFSSIFPDPIIAQTIAAAFGRAPSARVTQAELNEIWGLEVTGWGTIWNLQGLQFLNNLELLDLANNAIQDIRPLSNLRNLAYLSLVFNQVSDLSPLSGLSQLEWLWAHSNELSNVQPLSGLTNLTWLELSLNQIQNIHPLSGLTNLEILGLSVNRINNIQPLSSLRNLYELFLGQNPLVDLRPLAGLTRLERLRLSSNQIHNIDSLSGLTNLTDLWLGDNQIADFRPLNNMNRLYYWTAFGQTITASPAMVVEGSLTFENVMRHRSGASIAPFRVSDGGTYQSSTLNWTGLADDLLFVTYEFNQWPISGTVTIPLSDTPFSDVHRGHWFNNSVATAYREGFIAGLPDGTFGPGGPFTRGMAAMILWNMEGSPAPQSTAPFTDMAGHWAEPAVAWAAENDVVHGRPSDNGTYRFDPNDPMTRQELFAIKRNFAGEIHGVDTAPGTGPRWPFPDHSQISDWAVDAVAWAHYNDLVHGNEAGYVTPQGGATRAEAATIIVRFDNVILR